MIILYWLLVTITMKLIGYPKHGSNFRAIIDCLLCVSKSVPSAPISVSGFLFVVEMHKRICFFFLLFYKYLIDLMHRLVIY